MENKSMKDTKLWNKIQSFHLDLDGVDFTFSQRLARDNNWSHDYALRVIEEYKKYVYLSAISNEPLTPSDEVDQCWHLHLTYTKSYWLELCGEVLHHPLHHNPTQGGDQQRSLFKSSYQRSKDLYHKEFGNEPPSDIWPSERERFGKAPFYRRIDTSGYFMVPKPFVKTTFALFICSLMIAGCNFFKDALEDNENDGDLFIFTILIIFLCWWVIVKVLRKLGLLKPRKSRRNKNDSSGCGGCFLDSGGDGGGSGCSGCGGCG